MHRPVPTDDEVASLKEVWRSATGVNLEGEELRDCATRILQLYCLIQYPHLHSKPRNPDYPNLPAGRASAPPPPGT